MLSCPNKRLKVWKDLVKAVGENKAYVLWANYDGNVPENYYKSEISTSEVYQLKPLSDEGIKATENTIRDLAARLSNRTGIKYSIINDPKERFKGKLLNDRAVINLAYATLDTPIHEIVAHPLIRAIKNKHHNKEMRIEGDIEQVTSIDTSGFEQYIIPIKIFDESLGAFIDDHLFFDTREEAEIWVDDFKKRQEGKSTLYKSLVDELKRGVGKEVFDRIKQDYVIKISSNKDLKVEPQTTVNGVKYVVNNEFGNEYLKYDNWENGEKLLEPEYDTKEEAQLALQKYVDSLTAYYTEEEQEEEAIVELLGLYTANKIDEASNTNLISLLKKLFKQLKDFMKELFRQKDIKIDELPDNMKISDLSTLLAYTNSKLIMPGYEVEYATPDGLKHKTYEEANTHMKELVKKDELDKVNIEDVNIEPDYTDEQKEKIENIENEIAKLHKTLNSIEYLTARKQNIKNASKILKILEDIPMVFSTQETNLSEEDHAKYGIKGYTYARTESTYSRPEIYDNTKTKKRLYEGYAKHRAALGENYEGYYIHAYSNNYDKNSNTYEEPKIIKISKKEAEDIWNKDPYKNHPRELRNKISDAKYELQSLQNNTVIKNKISNFEYDLQAIQNNSIESFITENNKYELSKEVIEKWKKINNIKYNPEEVYSRNQEFYSVIGAYANLDQELLLQNILHHIEDNEKAGGKFAVSAVTAPLNKNLNHLGQGNNTLKIKIFPNSEDILWASNKDVYSGSTTDAAEKIKAHKRNELVGVTYTKYPEPRHLNSKDISPNLADIIDGIDHHHNELGIVLTSNNFRIEYGPDTDFNVKKVADGLNKILDQKYGKPNKPDYSKYKDFKLKKVYKVFYGYGLKKEFDTLEDAKKFQTYVNTTNIDGQIPAIKTEYKKGGIAPKITNDNLKTSITDIKNKTGTRVDTYTAIDNLTGTIITAGTMSEIEEYMTTNYPGYDNYNVKKSIVDETKPKKYTDQIKVNLKVKKLKGVIRKYPRILVTSKVKKIQKPWQGMSVYDDSMDEMFGEDDLPWQKIPSKKAPFKFTEEC